ncbi:Phosphatase 2C family protein isoform 1 [Hibiscus syriacus]|uniref:Phosphatase 2C family protein isoform 1 n=1 Tax=Hibiscus syriacus TaxID=106335 RepID=A0A6A3A4X9_HIBSY|nr:Phosphatase 2C family protein isoform 1 [Hibiscus syriacus]
MNSSYNVSSSTLRTMTDEFRGVVKFVRYDGGKGESEERKDGDVCFKWKDVEALSLGTVLETTWDSRRLSDAKVSLHAGSDKLGEIKGVADGQFDGKKRKTCEYLDATGLVEQTKGNAENNMTNGSKNLSSEQLSSHNSEVDGSLRYTPHKGLHATAYAASTKEAENLAIEQIMSGPYVSHQALEEPEELEDDLEFRNSIVSVGNTNNGLCSLQSCRTYCNAINPGRPCGPEEATDKIELHILG